MAYPYQRQFYSLATAAIAFFVSSSRHLTDHHHIHVRRWPLRFLIPPRQCRLQPTAMNGMASRQRIPPVRLYVVTLIIAAEGGPGTTGLDIAPVQHTLVAVATFVALPKSVMFLEGAVVTGHCMFRHPEPLDETPGAGGA